MIENKGKATIR